ncbi:protein-L-isoaspartate O-methyltransferase [Candidatus Micrarchaeota archaeon]|nr:protein-L-isoaspartate O-methyltransferase [Candidatus Micrarchaeota archaeon]
MQDFESERKKLVMHLSDVQAVKTKSVGQAFLSVKREEFFEEAMKSNAYVDSAFSIGFGQTISQPYTIAVMLEMLKLSEGMNVLDVGSGSGYTACLISEIVGEKGKVIGVELVKELYEKTKENPEIKKRKNIELFNFDATKKEFKEKFDRILISAACPFLPKPLFDALKEKGIAVAPIGDAFSQRIQSITKLNGKPFKKEFLQGFFVFVPLKGSFQE